MKLSLKVYLAFAAVIGIALVTVSILVGQLATDAYRGYVTGYQRQQLSALASEAARLYEAGNSWDDVQAWIDETLTTDAMKPGMGPGGRGQGRGPRMVESMALAVYVTDVQGNSMTKNPTPDFEPVATAPIVVRGTPVAALAASTAMVGMGAAEQAVIDQVYRAIFWSALVAGLVALGAGALLLTSILRPLRRLDAAVDDIAQGNYGVRVTAGNDDELGRLATNFNRMAGALEEQETLRRRMVADIAHELRTPLSVVQGNLQAILDGVFPLTEDEIRQVYDETRLLARLVSDLHDLAQAEAGQLQMTFEPVEASDALYQTAAAFRAAAQERAIALTATASPVIIAADSDRLQQILNNLVGNALRHTPTGGAITLTARHGETTVRLSVTNSGPVIPPEQLRHIFDRFYRADASRRRDDYTTGAGLGLSIAKALVEAQQGRIGVDSNNVSGTTFWVELPRSSDVSSSRYTTA